MTGFDPRATYEALCRPISVRLMRAMRLDMAYESAEGNRLIARDSDDRTREVIDFVGGYGSTIFGHHHPRLVAAAKEALDQRRPFAAQGSIRTQAARLASCLHDMIEKRTSTSFGVLLASTGAEATEMALKHAELAFQSRQQALRAHLVRTLRGIDRGLAEGRLRLAPEIAPPPSATLTAWLCARFDAAFASLPPGVIALERGFHGKTVGALSLTHFVDYRAPFERLLLHTFFVPINDVDALGRIVREHTVAIDWPEVDRDGVVRLTRRTCSGIVALFAEPLQGEGGIRPLSLEFAATARRLADTHGFHLIFDEIQSGMGRTGTFLFAEQLGVVPDAFLLSKSLGGGLAKASAFLIRRSLMEERFCLLHSSTFAEDDLSCSIAIEALCLLEDDQVAERAASAGAYLREGLERLLAAHHPILHDVRGAGLMLGLELGAPEVQSPGVIRALADQGMLGYAVAAHLLNVHGLRVMPCISQRNVLRLEPSAYIEAESMERLLSALDSVLGCLHAGDAHALLQHVVGERQRPPVRTLPTAVPREPADNESVVGRVGFVGYFIDVEQMPRWDGSLGRFSLAQRTALIERVFAELEPSRLRTVRVRSPRGGCVELSFYGLFVDSLTFYAHLRGPMRSMLRAQVQQAAEMARDDGCNVVGFGGLTSVITSNCRELPVEGIGLTTGNSLTVAMCLDNARREARAMGIDLGQATVAVVGAGGNIGSIYALEISVRAARLVLLCRPGREADLRALAHRLYERAFAELRFGQQPRGLARTLADHPQVRRWAAQGDAAVGIGPKLEALFAGSDAPVHITSDIGALRRAAIILCASNAPHALVHPEHIGPKEVLVVDVAVPGDAHMSLRRLAPRVRVVSGGAVDLGPLNRELDPYAPLPHGHLYACATETVVLGFEGWRGNYSVGDVRVEQVEEIRSLASSHGFAPAQGEHSGALEPLKRLVVA